MSVRGPQRPYQRSPQRSGDRDVRRESSIQTIMCGRDRRRKDTQGETMNRKSHVRVALFAGAAVTALTASQAFAQAPAASSGGGQALEEVVVTATRQSD